MSESAKYETISLRLLKQDADLIRSYAVKEKTSLSSIIRSTMNKLVNNQIVFVDDKNTSLSSFPALDKLSFHARSQIFRPIDFFIGSLMLSGYSVSQVEQILLDDARIALTRENIEFHHGQYQELEINE